MAEVEARALTREPAHHFFGYYDKFPWDSSGRYVLGMQVSFMDRPPWGQDAVTIGMVDTAEENAWQPLAETTAWCWQQGTMLQWLGSAPDRLVVFNTRQADGYASTVLDVHSGERRSLSRPVYAVSGNGKWAVSVNFARLGVTRPGYGYNGIADPWEDELAPADDGIYWMDLESGEHRLIVSLAQIVATRPQESMAGAKHWFNHLQFNTDDSRFLFLHRWTDADGRRHTRLFTSDPDGGHVHCVNDHDMTSHFDWRNPTHILAWARQHEIGDRYFLFEDRDVSQAESGRAGQGEGDDIGTATAIPGVRVIGEDVFDKDGHCSFSPDGQWMLTDTYPDAESMRTLILYHLKSGQRVDVGRYYAIPEITGEFRCDLHPRWSRDGRYICFDSVHEGTRQIYVMDVGDVVG
ncbi:hypothetical protein ACFL6X_00095 [Candidatus Latescibacterota bacterium]